MDTRECTKCHRSQDVSEFYVVKGRRGDRIHPWCKECTRAYNRDYTKRNPEANRLRARRSRVKAKYGITWQERDQMIAEQGGKCAICQEPFTSTKTTHIDHCHGSKGVRGILCWPCNIGLGNYRDNPDRLRAAADYLERYQANGG
jgi:hypothetical protein